MPWIEGDLLDAADPMLEGALQSLHGVTMAYDPATPHLIHHGPPGTYVKSMDDIREEYACWRQDCAEYDADPVAYRPKVGQIIETSRAFERLRSAKLRAGDETTAT